MKRKGRAGLGLGLLGAWHSARRLRHSVLCPPCELTPRTSPFRSAQERGPEDTARGSAEACAGQRGWSGAVCRRNEGQGTGAQVGAGDDGGGGAAMKALGSHMRGLMKGPENQLGGRQLLEEWVEPEAPQTCQ